MIFPETCHRAVILGAGQGGTAMFELLRDEKMVTIVGVVDVDPHAPGMQLARQHGIPTYDDVGIALRKCSPCVAFNLTHDKSVEKDAVDILGAGSLIGGMEANLVWRMVTNLKKAKDELRYHATHDALTGLHNRHYMNEQLRQGVMQAIRYGLSFSVALIDIDHFKQVNDNHGHAAGDQALKHVAGLLQQGLRAADILGRWGGEEFIIVLPHTGLDGAMQVARHCLQRVGNEAVEVIPGVMCALTLSAGVAELKPEDVRGFSVEQAMDHLLALADARLYDAKSGGRARVMGEGNQISTLR